MNAVADLAAAMAFLASHPDLPHLNGVSLGSVDGDSITVSVETPEQVKMWADAIGAEVSAHPYKGTVQHNTFTFTPFYVSVTAIVPEATP